MTGGRAIDRFSLFVVVRSQVSDRAIRRQCLALEATMAALAQRAGVDPVAAGLAGLAARIDIIMTAHNPDRRGLVAEELLATECVPAPVVAAVRDCYQAPDVATLSRLAALLVAADGLVDFAYDGVADVGLDEVDARGIGVALERLARRRGDSAAVRIVDALAAVGVSADDAAADMLAAMTEIRADLAL